MLVYNTAIQLCVKTYLKQLHNTTQAYLNVTHGLEGREYEHKAEAQYNDIGELQIHSLAYIPVRSVKFDLI